MKLINARGMSEALYDMKEGIKNQLSSLLKSFFFTQTVLELESGKIKNNNYYVKQDNKNVNIYDKSHKLLFTLSEKDDVSMSFVATSLMYYDVVYSIKKLNEKHVNDFFEDVLPNYEEKIDICADVYFLIMLNSDPEMQNYNDVFSDELPKLFDYAKKSKNLKNAFVYNDFDNSFYMSKNKLILSNQNFKYTVTNDDGLYTVKVLVNHEDPNERLNAEFYFDTNKDIDKLHIKLLDQPFVLTHFILDLHFGVNAYEKVNKIKADINPLVKTYDYHLAYLNENYDLTKEEIIWRLAFYCFPEGNDKAGNYIYDSRDFLPYQKKSEAKTKDIHNTIKHGDFSIPVTYRNNEVFKKMDHVNEDWKRYFIEVRGLVADFLEKYKVTDDKTKAKMSHTESKELIKDLEEFLKVTEKLVSPDKVKTNKIKLK